MTVSPVDVVESRRSTLALPEIRAALEHDRARRAEQLLDLPGANGAAAASTAHAAGASSEEVSRELQAKAIMAVTEIDAALARIDRGTYGACERCNGAIAIERLEALPTTRVCLACARHRDRAIG